MTPSRLTVSDSNAASEVVQSSTAESLVARLKTTLAATEYGKTIVVTSAEGDDPALPDLTFLLGSALKKHLPLVPLKDHFALE